MNFSIRYLTEYRYERPVTDNLNSLRVAPAQTPTQRVDDFGVRVDPETRLHRHTDYFGTTVIEFGISKPHDHLSIDVRARVATSEPPEPPAATWEAVESPAYRRCVGEFGQPTADSPEDIILDDMVGDVRAETPLATLERLSGMIPDRFQYRTGVTYVGSTVRDLLDAGAGVCQDFAHLSLLLLRRNGLGARYVSGYLFVAPPDGDEDSDSAEVDTHAWVEAALPTEDPGEVTWVAVDPTNRCLASTRHVKIGHGRNYADVPPIKGVYRGAGLSELTASVRMSRTDRGARAT